MSFPSISFSRIVPLDSEDSLYFVKTVSIRKYSFSSLNNVTKKAQLVLKEQQKMLTQTGSRYIIKTDTHNLKKLLMLSYSL